MTKDTLVIFDTTLRDGEQAPSATMNFAEKLLIAKTLEQMGVDVIEAGFPAASDGDFNAVNQIAKNAKTSRICGLSRAKKNDIEKAGLAVKDAPLGRIHTFIATSDVHMKYKLKMDKKQVLEAISDSVSLACSLCDDVEWSAEDAVRTDKDFLFKAIEMAIKSGAKTVNIPDTVGYATPMEYFDLISAIKNNVSNIDKAIISTHCHNDLGLAVANSLAGAQAGARQIECTINGIGERAGNAALEELVMTLKTRPDIYNLRTNVNSKLITRASKLVSNITGFPIQYNKAIVGANAFAHESGIHQDGMLKNRNTYEIMTPESVGLDKSSLVLGKHSGRAAFKDKLQEIGYNLSDETLESSFKRFKDLADKKKEVLDDDIIAIIDNLVVSEKSAIKLIDLAVNCGKLQQAKVELELSIDGKNIKTSHESKDGPVDAIFSAIQTLIPHEASLELYQVNAVTSGIDAQAVVVVRLKQNNRTYSATGSSTDVLVASTKAYIHCLEKLPNLGSS